MNYLAHLYLAQRNPHSLVGNLMGDFLRGVKVRHLPAIIARGVHNHLAVDRYTDSHAALKALKTNFSAERRRFGGIIIDVVFDHFLIKHWQAYSREELAGFTAYCYQCFSALSDLMPPPMRQRVDWIIQCDLLNSYADLQGVAEALNGISRRMRFENRLAGAIDEVTDHYAALEQGFLAFFTQLRAHVRHINIEEAENAGGHAGHGLVHCNPPGRSYRAS